MSGDEFVTPSVITGKSDETSRSGTAFVMATPFMFYNYRGDRPREITKAFTCSTRIPFR